MTKIIEIERCGECPYRKFNVGELSIIDKCTKKGYGIGITQDDVDTLNKQGFPKWCPLRDINDLKDDLSAWE